ncbi:MAG: hypothetical protein WCK11_02405 [Candidatus Falkowbacteria bacterium]
MKHFASRVALILVMLFALSGCGQAPAPISQDQDGKLHYTNQDLGFELYLPKQFEYFQTQRKNLAEYTDVEFFAPTSDMGYKQEVQSYGKFLIVRVKKQAATKPDTGFMEAPNNQSGKFWLQFWEKQPKDWSKKWNKEVQKDIINTFKAL